MTFPWLESAAGALTGFVVGLTGVGGGALMTPLLLLFFGIAPHTAIGTDLWFAALTKLAITPLHRGRGVVDWLVLRRLWLGSLPASAATSLWVGTQPLDAHTTDLLRAAIAGAVVLTALGLLFQAALRRRADRVYMDTAVKFVRWQPIATVFAGALLGVMVTLTSVGAGALGAVMLVYLYPTRLTPPRLVATDIAHAIPLAMFAGAGHLIAGGVDLRLLLALLAGSIPAALLATALSARMPHAALRAALAAVLLIVGLKLAASTF
jgi:uncharacterized membrane protein YfcA